MSGMSGDYGQNENGPASTAMEPARIEVYDCNQFIDKVVFLYANGKPIVSVRVFAS